MADTWNRDSTRQISAGQSATASSRPDIPCAPVPRAHERQIAAVDANAVAPDALAVERQAPGRLLLLFRLQAPAGAERRSTELAQQLLTVDAI